MNKKLDCTLIIPSHNRHEYLDRIFEYYTDVNFNVICCDSSDNKYEKELPDNISYNHVPGLNFKEKMYKTISEVDTEYIVCCADDDFILKESIPEGVDFLDENTDYNSFVGQYSGFLKPFNASFYQNPSQSSSYLPSIGIDNITSFMQNYHMILWCLYRKEDVVVAYDIINEASFSNDNFIELIIGITLASRGKIKINNSLWGIREIDSQGDHWGKRHKSLCIEEKSKISNDIKEIKSVLPNKLDEYFFDVGLEAYMIFCNKSVLNNNRNTKSFKSKLISYIKSKIPLKIKSFIRWGRRTVQDSKELNEIKKVLENYEKNN